MISAFLHNDWAVQIFAATAICLSTYLASKTVIETRKQFNLVRRLKLSHQMLDADLSNDELVGEPLRDALARFEDHARRFDPDHIVGVHLGGRLLSTLICKRLSMPHTRCHYFETGRATQSFPELHSTGNEAPNGKVLIVDDITRGGTTIGSASKYFVNQSARNKLKISEMNFATLVQVLTPSKARRGYIAPDWSAHRTNTETFQLAWTPVSSKVEAIYRSHSPNSGSPEVAFFEKLVNDFDFAHHVALLAIDNFEQLNSVSADSSYYRDWKSNSEQK